MNERFKKLALKAGCRSRKFTTGVGMYQGVDNDLQKFAELIVRECVKVMYDNAIERKVPPDINQTPTHYAIAVLEHFGVEE